ncbi:MAG: hypothetical protein NXH87_00895 [Rhodobiaceae bacterium]|nr:hypothetical protein [Rhodobiaceae bacterium]
MLGCSLGTVKPILAPLQLALAKTPGAHVHADYRSNLYYGSSQIHAAASGVTANVPAGEPTSAGMLVDGSDAPTLVQGSGPVPYPGNSGSEYTAKVAWDANGVTGDRVIWEARKNADNRLTLHFVSGLLRFESFVSGASEGFVAVAGVDDGNTHRAILYWDDATGTLSLDVDGQGLEGPEIFVNGSFDTWTDQSIPDGWIKSNHDASNYVEESPAGSMRLISDGANISVIQTNFTPGLVYEVTTSDVAVTTGSMALWYGAGLQFTLPGGTSTAIIEPSSTNAALKRVSGNTDVSIGGISGKAIYARSGLTLPDNLVEYALGHSGGENQLNGYIPEISAANGDYREMWSPVPS